MILANSSPGFAEIIIQSISALATLAAVVVALFRDPLERWLQRPRIAVTVKDPGGTLLTRANGARCRYWHLHVRNECRWFRGQRAQVRITELMYRQPCGEFQREKLTLPLPLFWAHWDVAGVERELADFEVCDIGSIDGGQPEFQFAVHYAPNNVRVRVRPNETVRAHLEFIANSSVLKKLVLELHWDGTWSENDEDMARHIAITLAEPRVGESIDRGN